MGALGGNGEQHEFICLQEKAKKKHNEHYASQNSHFPAWKINEEFVHHLITLKTPKYKTE